VCVCVSTIDAIDVPLNLGGINLSNCQRAYNRTWVITKIRKTLFHAPKTYQGVNLIKEILRPKSQNVSGASRQLRSLYKYAIILF
jgi:hypothetical protein